MLSSQKSVVEGGIALVAFPDHAAIIQDADEGGAKLGVANFDPPLGLDPCGEMRIAPVDAVRHLPTQNAPSV